MKPYAITCARAFRALAVITSLGLAPQVQALPVLGYADVVLSYSDSGAGPLLGPYGGLDGAFGTFPVAVPTTVVLGDDVPGAENFLSLPTGSQVTVGFLDETVLDGVGDDIFIQEIGSNNERAHVFVSADNTNFTLLGTAIDNGSTAFDLADIMFALPVTAIRIVGLDNLGGSPGFDVVNVQVLPGSVGPGKVPEPATLPLLLLAAVAGAIALSRPTQRRRS